MYFSQSHKVTGILNGMSLKYEHKVICSIALIIHDGLHEEIIIKWANCIGFQDLTQK